MIEAIKQLKKEKNAVILAHCYQNLEIDEVADYVGDSLYLSQMAAKTDADIIVFAGVYFMAETAKMLSPKKTVLLPNQNAGCFMADMLNLNQLQEFKSMYKSMPVVCYVNSSAEVKSESDYCCTSSNAVEVVKAIGAEEILFVPDANLGAWVSQQLPDIKVNTYSGYCPTHVRIKVEDIREKQKKYPDALVLAHPECKKNILDLADYVGSTKGIINYAANSDKTRFIIATELGVVERLQRDYPQKEFILASRKAVCPNMKTHSLQDIYNALKYGQYAVNVEEQIAQKAVKCINRMLDISR